MQLFSQAKFERQSLVLSATPNNFLLKNRKKANGLTPARRLHPTLHHENKLLWQAACAYSEADIHPKISRGRLLTILTP
jgi:hypothetical protein